MSDSHPTPSPGWFRAMRTPEALELIQADPLAYVLAAIIAHRGRYNVGFNAHNLGLGEALLGDYRSYGMTRQQYRTAIKHLTEWHFATFKSTNKGTVGKLIDTRLFSIFRVASNQQENQQPTNSQPTANQQLTTNEERKSDKNDERASKTRETPVRFCKGTTDPERSDWNGLTTREKMLQVLGNAEIAKRPDWITRLQTYPGRMETIINEMHSDLATGHIIKNRGAYAETLWRIAK